MAVRPVRTPHHSTSAAALVGGGAIPQPGEVSLAHHGVLFLDEFPEFARPTLEMIRQPLEDGCVTIPRVHSTLKFPAKIMLVAAMNPCPCGYYTDPKRQCTCSPPQVERYLSRVIGAADRPHRHPRRGPAGAVEAAPLGRRRDQLGGHAREGRGRPRDSAAAVRPGRRVVRGAGGDDSPTTGNGSTTTNATMSSRQVRQFCKLDAAGETILKQAMTELGLSARAHDKVLRIARTIADLEGVENVTANHLAEAIQYRRLDRKM